MLDPDGVRLLACAMIHRALIDMRTRGRCTWSFHRQGVYNRKVVYRAYVDGTIWLATRKASIWFDYLDGVGHRTTLHASNWKDYAYDLLDDPLAELQPDEISVLVDTIDSLEADLWMATHSSDS
jgi:hypothetical protein